MNYNLPFRKRYQDGGKGYITMLLVIVLLLAGYVIGWAAMQAQERYIEKIEAHAIAQCTLHAAPIGWQRGK